MDEKEKATQFVKGIQKELDDDKAVKKQLEARYEDKRQFKTLPDTAIHDFFCQHCQADFTAPCYKSWSEFNQFGAWIGFCPRCTGMVSRWITNQKNDPYYEMSHKVGTMRYEFQHDMLQPDMYGFNTLYGDPFEKYFHQFGSWYEEATQLGASLGLTGVTYKDKENKAHIDDMIQQ